MDRFPPWFARGLRVAALAAVVLLGAFGVSRLSYDVDLLELLPVKLPGVAGTAVLQRVFERPDQLLVTLRDDQGGDLERAAAGLAGRLAVEPGLARAVRHRVPWEERPEALVELVAYAWWNAPPESVTALAESLAPERLASTVGARVSRLATALDPVESAFDANDLLGLTAALRAGVDPAVAESFADGGFGNAEGTFRVVQVDAPAPLAGYREAAAWLDGIRRAVAAWQAADPAAAAVKVGFTGQPAFQAEIGSGMQRDMAQSVSGITFVVGFLFWLLHRRLRPLFLLMAAILATALVTLGLAGFLFGSLNVMSMGFAAILMGMIEDFGVLGLNEAMERPGAGFAEVHRRVAAPVWWSAFTSAAVFASLGLSSLPGIAQMGILTATGILAGAAVMLYGFLPLAMKRPCQAPGSAWMERVNARPAVAAWVAGSLAVAALAVLAGRGLPPVVTGNAVLRPKHCEAFTALEEYQQRMLPDHGRVTWIPVVAEAGDPAGLATALHRAGEVLEGSAGRDGVLGHFLPVGLAPDPARQAANGPRLAAFAAERERVFRAADEAGVTGEGLALARGVFGRWQEWGAAKKPFREPDTGLLDDAIGRQLHRSGEHRTACGYVRIERDSLPAAAGLLAKLEAVPGIELAGWDYLEGHLTGLLGAESLRVLLPASLVLTALMFVVFRGWRERLVTVVSLGFAALVLLAFMAVAGIGWNFVNIGAIPLCLGLGLDFHIHMVHALRHADRSGESTTPVSRALAYCGLSTGLAFGALSLSDNNGLSTFGTCAMTGVLATLFSAAFLVPALWRAKSGRRVAGSE